MLSDNLIWKIFKGVCLLVVAVLLGKLFYLQVLKYDFYNKISSSQTAARITFSKNRGIIYDGAGKILAANRKRASLFLFGKNIKDEENAVRVINELKKGGVKISKDTENSILDRDDYVWIKRGINISEAEKIKQAVRGVDYRLEEARTYPEGKMLKGILGYTGIDNQGLAGLEYFYDNILAPEAIPANIVKDLRNNLIIYDDAPLRTEPDSAVYLTVDSSLQAIVDRILKLDTQEYKAKSGIAIAMDVSSGEILAASSITNSDENKNYFTSYLFEPGSIFKAVSFGYLIENKIYNPTAKVDTSRPIEIAGHPIKDVKAFASLSQSDVFIYSSNIGTVILTKKVGSESFYNFLIKSGFGVKLALEGMSEEKGVLRKPKEWSVLSLPSLSIGQEIMVTPIQMLRYYAAIGNKGVAVKPFVVKKYVRHGKEYYSKSSSERILSEETADTLLSLLTATVKKGTGLRAQSQIVDIGGKTATAQFTDPVTKTYSKTDYVASFVGLFPVDKPRIALIVIFDKPRSSIYGGATGAVTFKKIAEELAYHYSLGTASTKVEVYANR
jgi:cell division protein FtsI (penicillin-binding protein 3)